jgi:hypothetical protein
MYVYIPTTSREERREETSIPKETDVNEVSVRSTPRPFNFIVLMGYGVVALV